MRIAIVYDCLYPVSRGGGERVYRRMAELLAAQGHEVVYLTRAGQVAADDAPPFDVLPVWDGSISDATGTRTVGAALRFAAAVRQALRRRRGEFDVVIASALPVLTLLGARLGIDRRTTLVADWLEVWPWTKWRAYAGTVSGTIAAVLQRVGARAAAVHTVNSEFTARRLAAIAPAARIEVLGLFDLVDAPPDPRPAAVPPTAVFLGRLISDKRADRIPAAIAAARRRVPNLRAVIAGRGPEQDRILAEVERCGLVGVVDVPGFVDDGDATRLVGEAAVMVHPSAREGFGLVVVEAAALGVPVVVVAGADNAAAALVEPGVNGEIAADVDTLADAIVDVIERGPQMRASTLAWYRDRVGRETLAASLHRVLDMVGSPATGADRRSSRRG